MEPCLSFNDFVQQIDKRLIPYQNDLVRTMKVSPSSIHFLLSGKRLRSSLIYSSNSIDSLSLKKELCVLVELIHAASLIHDDLVDESTLRRGHSTLQMTYNDIKAIGAGHLLFSHIFTSILELPLRWQEYFFMTLREMCLGEIWEIEDMAQPDFNLIRYMNIIRKKTAVLFALCCGLSEPNQWNNAESIFGLYYGIAFQLYDDTLDMVSSTKVLGKPSKRDDQMSIPTLPLFLKRRYPDDMRYSIHKSIFIASQYLLKAKQSTQNSEWVKEADQLNNNIQSLFF